MSKLALVWLVLVAGCGGSGDGAAIDAGGALDAAPDASVGFMRGPSARSEAAVVFDPTSSKLLLFGGDQGTVQAQVAVPDVVGDSWLLDTRTGMWTALPAGGPSARSRTVAVYDSSQRRALVFGGRYRVKGAPSSAAYTLYNEVWAFSFADETWSMLTTSGTAPSRRFFAAAGYDAMANSLYIFGGNTSTAGVNFIPAGDTFQLELGTGAWTTVAATGPAARHYAQFAFDEGRRRLVVFSGKGASFNPPSFADTWALDVAQAPPTWTRLDPGVGTGAPIARFGGAMVYDKDRDRLLLWGGHHDENTAGDIANDSWAFNLSSNSWARLRMGDTINGTQCIVGGAVIEPLGLDYATPDLMSPERRFKHALVVNPSAARVLVIGGESDCAKMDDIWQLDLATTDGVWTRALKASQGEGCVRRNDQCPCFCN